MTNTEIKKKALENWYETCNLMEKDILDIIPFKFEPSVDYYLESYLLLKPEFISVLKDFYKEEKIMIIKLDSIGFYKLNEYLMELVDQGAKLVVRTYNGALLINGDFKYYIYSKEVL